MLVQLIIFTLVTGCLYLLLGISASLSFSVTRFFNLSTGSIISLGAYFVYHFHSKLGLSLSISILLAVSCSVLLALFFELILFGYMRKKLFSPLSLLLVSIGLFTILQNIIPLVWGDETISLRAGVIKKGYQLAGVYFTDIQVITIIAASLLSIVLIAIVQKTNLGKAARAVSSNVELSEIYGINSNKIILQVVAISSAITAFAGILVALDVDVAPFFGFNYFLYGVVVMIIGGVGSYRGLVWASFLLAAAQHLAAYYFDTKWMDAIAYMLLILFLLWKPLGISGQQLRKKQV